jgi:hypothetical protein
MHKIFGKEYDDDEELQEKLMFYKNKVEQAKKDLSSLLSEYRQVDEFLKFLLNNFKFIMINPDLNEKNKKLKIVELISSFKAKYKEIIESFKTEIYDFLYLRNLKEEIIRYLKSNYQILVSYIIQSQSLEMADLNL